MRWLSTQLPLATLMALPPEICRRWTHSCCGAQAAKYGIFFTAMCLKVCVLLSPECHLEAIFALLSMQYVQHSFCFSK